MIITINTVDKSNVDESIANLVNVLTLFDLNKNLKYYSLTKRELSFIVGVSETYIYEVLRGNEKYHFKSEEVILKLRKILFNKIKNEISQLV